MATVHLVDASPYIFRAYFSLPSSIQDREGRPVGGVYGFAGFLIKLLADERPTHLGVAFDRSLTTSFRNEIYPAYKAQRDLPPPELEAQLGLCEELARAMGAATFVDPVYEADDLIATLAGQLLAHGHGAVVITSDKDMAQLVEDGRVTMLDFGKGERYTAAEVARKLGVRPDQVADLLALAGDPVDNIPGVPGIGRKTAAELLAAYGHLEDLYQKLDEIAASKRRGAAGLAAKLASGRELAFLSKRLVALARDAPVRADLAELAWRGADREAFTALCDRLGFGRIRERVPLWK